MANFLDNFTGSAGILTGHTADSGQSWALGVTSAAGSVSLNGSGAVGPTNSSVAYVYFANWTPPSANYQVSATIISEGTQAGSVGPAIRHNGGTSSAACYFGRYDSSITGYQIYKLTGGSTFTQLGTTNTAPAAPTTGDVLEIVASGTTSPVTLTLYKNGTAVVTATDSSSPLTAAGYPGLWLSAYASPTTGLFIDQLTAVGAPTLYTMTGPSVGVVGVASANYTVTLNAPAGTTVVITPASTGSGDTFSPSTVSITSGNSTGTFTLTPGTTGSRTVSATNNASLTNPASLTYGSYTSLTTAPVVASFGPTYGGLATVGYTVVSASGSVLEPRSTSGVFELVAGSGQYAVLASFPPTFTGWVVLDTGTGSPVYTAHVVSLVATVAPQFVVNFGVSYSGLATVGYTLFNSNGTTYQARTTSGVTELVAGSGQYGSTATPPSNFNGFIVWDTGGASPVYASDSLNTTTGGGGGGSGGGIGAGLALTRAGGYWFGPQPANGF